MAQLTTCTCHLCGTSDLSLLIDFGAHPVAKHYLEDISAVSPTWPVRLFFCNSCGLSQLVDSCPPEVLYDNYVTLSAWKSQPHVQHEIELIETLDGIGKNAKVIEIGCNDGGFLHQLSINGFKHILGIEPAKDAFDLAVAKGINAIQQFLKPDLARSLVANHGQFDLFLSRQNLEHMGDLQGVAESMRVLVKPNGYALIEVPNFDCNLRCHDYGLWEEHVNYFTIDTLRRFLALAGFELIHAEVILFSGEGIIAIGRNTGNVASTLDYLAALRDKTLQYAAFWPAFRAQLSEFLALQKREGKKIAVYGAGSRVFGLMNFVDISQNIDVIVDDQVEKQNKFMPGGRIPIVSSDALYSMEIDICLLAVNTENEGKVIAKHEKWITQGGTFWSVLPPSDMLLPFWKGE
jgi:SAM-dependent methyltransferase